VEVGELVFFKMCNDSIGQVRWKRGIFVKRALCCFVHGSLVE